VARCLQLMAPSDEQRRLPVFFVFPKDREEELLAAFEGTEFLPMEVKADHLKYRSSVPSETQERIHLFGPVGMSC